MDVEVDADGNIYVADVTRFEANDDVVSSHRIRRIGPDGVITTIAGGEACGYSGDGGPAVDAELCYPSELTVGDDGTIFLVDEEHHQIRVISPDGVIDSLPTYVDDPSALAVGPDGALYVGDGDRGQVHRIPLDADPPAADAPETSAGVPDRWADADPRVITVVAGTGRAGVSFGDGPALEADLLEPDSLAVGPDGTPYLFDASRQVRAIRPDGTITTVAGGGEVSGDHFGPGPMPGDGRLASEVILGTVRGIDVASDGTLFMADYYTGHVLKVSPTGVITTAAGSGEEPDENETVAAGEPASHVGFRSPRDVAVAPDGSLYVLDSGASQILHIGLDGIVRVAAGTGSAGFSGDGGPATEAELEKPSTIDVAPDGTLYVVDGRGNRIRAIGTDGVITTIGGKEGPEYYDPEFDASEGVVATDVFLDIDGLAVDDAGMVYFSNHGSIRAIGPDGLITRLTSSGAGAVALAVDGHDNLYFAQSWDDQVSVLPKVSEDPVPVATEDEETGMQWWIVIIGVLVAAGFVALYGIVRVKRGLSLLPSMGRWTF